MTIKSASNSPLQELPSDALAHTMTFLSGEDNTLKNMSTQFRIATLLKNSIEAKGEPSLIRRFVSTEPSGRKRILPVCITTLTNTTGYLPDVQLSPDKSSYIANFLNEVKLYNAKKREEIATLTGHRSSIDRTGYSKNNRYITTLSRDKVQLWNATTGEKIATFTGHKNPILAIEWTSDNLSLKTCSIDETILWDLKTGEKTKASTEHKDHTHTVQPSHDNSSFKIYLRKEATLRNAKAEKEMKALAEHGHPIDAVQYSRDNSSFIIHSNGNATLCDRKTGKKNATFTGHTDEISTISRSSDNSLIIVRTPREIKFWMISLSYDERKLQDRIRYYVNLKNNASTEIQRNWFTHLISLLPKLPDDLIASSDPHVDQDMAQTINIIAKQIFSKASDLRDIAPSEEEKNMFLEETKKRLSTYYPDLEGPILKRVKDNALELDPSLPKSLTPDGALERFLSPLDQ